MNIVRELIVNQRIVKLGEIIALKTPAGSIEILGTDRGFAIRRPNSTQPDLRYEDGASLTIRYKDDKVIKISPAAPENWQANGLLDPMV